MGASGAFGGPYAGGMAQERIRFDVPSLPPPDDEERARIAAALDAIPGVVPIVGVMNLRKAEDGSLVGSIWSSTPN